jgi:hypothetical protein
MPDYAGHVIQGRIGGANVVHPEVGRRFSLKPSDRVVVATQAVLEQFNNLKGLWSAQVSRWIALEIEIDMHVSRDLSRRDDGVRGVVARQNPTICITVIEAMPCG